MFENLFKNTDRNSSKLIRISLTEESQIEEFLKLSFQKPVLLFKHSTRCGVSSVVLRRFEKKLNDKSDNYNYYYIDILRYRGISNKIAEKFNISHESPQLLVIEKGLVSSYESHSEILDIQL